MVQSRQKLLTVPSLVTTVCTKRVVRPPLTQLLQSLLGLVVFSTVQSWTTTPSLRTGARPLNVSLSSQLRTDKWRKTWQSACTEPTMLPDQPTLTPSSLWTRLPLTSTRHWENERVRYEVKIIYYFGQLLRNKDTWIFPDLFGRLCLHQPSVHMRLTCVPKCTISGFGTGITLVVFVFGSGISSWCTSKNFFRVQSTTIVQTIPLPSKRDIIINMRVRRQLIFSNS